MPASYLLWNFGLFEVFDENSLNMQCGLRGWAPRPQARKYYVVPPTMEPPSDRRIPDSFGILFFLSGVLSTGIVDILPIHGLVHGILPELDVGVGKASPHLWSGAFSYHHAQPICQNSCCVTFISLRQVYPSGICYRTQDCRHSIAFFHRRKLPLESLAGQRPAVGTCSLVK